VITRDFPVRSVWMRFNPPPLHTYDPACEAANWHPVGMPPVMPTPDGPRFIFEIPTVPYGDDPTDPAAQTKPRIPTTGMIGRFHMQGVNGQ